MDSAVVHLVVRDRVFHVQRNLIVETSPTMRLAYQHIDPAINQSVVENLPPFVSPEAVASLLNYLQKRQYVPPTLSCRLSATAEIYPPQQQHGSHSPTPMPSDRTSPAPSSGAEPRYEVTKLDIPDPTALVELFWLVGAHFPNTTEDLRRKVASDINVHLNHSSWWSIRAKALEGLEWTKANSAGAGTEQLEMVLKMAESYGLRNGLAGKDPAEGGSGERKVRPLPARKNAVGAQNQGMRSMNRQGGAEHDDSMSFDTHWTMIPPYPANGDHGGSSTTNVRGIRSHKKLRADEVTLDGPVDFV
ncbi:hypothetical protein BJ742DRAFT_89403 [Cladochytrium replicatum]|nr:hypothetical protein BJ742DRAFT_89403 [Cladochytrium replicatum]